MLQVRDACTVYGRVIAVPKFFFPEDLVTVRPPPDFAPNYTEKCENADRKMQAD
jgi:hypothetical protein